MCAQRGTNAIEHRPEVEVRLPATDLILNTLLVVSFVDSAPVRENLVAQHKWCLIEDHHIDRATQECLKVRRSFQAIERMGGKVVVGLQQERNIHIAAGGGAVACHGTKEIPGDDLGALGQGALQGSSDSLASEWFAGPPSCILSLNPGRVHSRQYRGGNAQVKPARKGGEHDSLSPYGSSPLRRHTAVPSHSRRFARFAVALRPPPARGVRAPPYSPSNPAPTANSCISCVIAWRRADLTVSISSAARSSAFWVADSISW